MNAAIQQLVSEFEKSIMAVAREQVHAEIMAKLGTQVAGKAIVLKTGKTRRKGPIQLCPAPGCKERAAPVFGMVCRTHKGTAKATVAKWRVARKKAKN